MLIVNAKLSPIIERCVKSVTCAKYLIIWDSMVLIFK